jgi:hypothetical protein
LQNTLRKALVDSQASFSGQNDPKLKDGAAAYYIKAGRSIYRGFSYISQTIAKFTPILEYTVV